MYNRFNWMLSILLLATLLSSLALGQEAPTPGKTNPQNPGSAWLTSPAQSAYVSERFQRADTLRNEGKNNEALVAINDAIRYAVDCGRCYGLKSGIEANLGLFRDGVADGDFGMKSSTTPRDKAMSAYNKGFSLSGLNRDNEALVAYNDSVALDPTYSVGHFGKGKVLYIFGQWAESKAALEQALSLNPKRGAAWAFLAEDQIYLGDFQAGLASANKAVEVAPSDPRSFRARTIAYLAIQNYEAMLADATRTLELDPNRPQAHLLRGHALNLLGRYSESASEYALEPDRKAIRSGFIPAQGPHMRIYNCGDPSTDIQTPDNFNGDGFTDCNNRINEQLDEVIRQLDALPTKRPLPSLQPKKVINK